MKYIVAAMIALASMTARAEFFTGNDLLAMLNSTEEPQRNMGLGYIAGAFDTGHGVVHCAPGNVTLGQAKDVIHNTLKNAPAIRHLTADVIVAGVLKQLWPCKQERPSSSSRSAQM